MTFSIPKDGSIFMSDVRERIETLIELGIWHGISRTQLNAWLTNFESDLELYFAACVLDVLIYRSELQTKALIQQFLQRTLPTVIDRMSLSINGGPDWQELLRSESLDPHIRFVPVVRDDDPPTKSAHWILRLMKRSFDVNEKWIWSQTALRSNIPSSVEAIIFVDDFLGTGSQFEEFYNGQDVQSVASRVRLAYLPLVAFSGGRESLTTTYSRLHVDSVERLDNSHRLFHPECECFQDGTNSVEDAKIFYYDLLRRRGISILGDERRGYGGLELAYSFAHASPDNCLPILWWDKSPSWKPLLER